ncbi:MAG: hypothetical protein VB933_01495 [Pseudomonadales bacterium]
MRRLLLACLSCCFMGSGSLTAEEVAERGGPPWLQPQVLEASMAIKMTVTQQGVFREAVGGFLDGLTTEYVSMMKQQKDDIPRRIKQARSRHARKMDTKMHAVLDDQQYERYLSYRKLLLTSTDVMVNPPSRRGTRGGFASNCRKRVWRPMTWCPSYNAS